MRMTIRHVYDFGDDRALVGEDLVRPDAWDALRTRTHGPFAMASTIAEAERTAQEHPELVARADALASWLQDEGIERVVSYGVGGGTMELLLHKHDHAPHLVLTDYGPETVEGLQPLFPDCQVVRHDLLSDPPLRGDLQLFHRIDTEFSNRQLHGLLKRFAAERILVMGSGTITVREGLHEIVYRFRNRNVTKAGWRRSRATFEALWSRTHDATAFTLHDLPAWDLRPRRS